MILFDRKREIPKEIYDRNRAHVYMSTEDMEKVFTRAELFGYGVYRAQVMAGEDGKYYVRYDIADSCD